MSNLEYHNNGSPFGEGWMPPSSKEGTEEFLNNLRIGLAEIVDKKDDNTDEREYQFNVKKFLEEHTEILGQPIHESPVDESGKKELLYRVDLPNGKSISVKSNERPFPTVLDWEFIQEEKE